MTERLYYSDPDLLEFEAQIVAVEKRGEDYLTLLDQSAFYPTSGGQSNDTGMLGEVVPWNGKIHMVMGGFRNGTPA